MFCGYTFVTLSTQNNSIAGDVSMSADISILIKNYFHLNLPTFYYHFYGFYQFPSHDILTY